MIGRGLLLLKFLTRQRFRSMHSNHLYSGECNVYVQITKTRLTNLKKYTTAHELEVLNSNYDDTGRESFRNLMTK